MVDTRLQTACHPDSAAWTTAQCPPDATLDLPHEVLEHPERQTPMPFTDSSFKRATGFPGLKRTDLLLCIVLPRNDLFGMLERCPPGVQDVLISP